MSKIVYTVRPLKKGERYCTMDEAVQKNKVGVYGKYKVDQKIIQHTQKKNEKDLSKLSDEEYSIRFGMLMGKRYRLTRDLNNPSYSDEQKLEAKKNIEKLDKELAPFLKFNAEKNKRKNAVSEPIAKKSIVPVVKKSIVPTINSKAIKKKQQTAMNIVEKILDNKTHEFTNKEHQMIKQEMGQSRNNMTNKKQKMAINKAQKILSKQSHKLSDQEHQLINQEMGQSRNNMAKKTVATPKKVLQIENQQMDSNFSNMSDVIKYYLRNKLPLSKLTNIRQQAYKLIREGKMDTKNERLSLFKQIVKLYDDSLYNGLITKTWGPMIDYDAENRKSMFVKGADTFGSVTMVSLSTPVIMFNIAINTIKKESNTTALIDGHENGFKDGDFESILLHTIEHESIHLLVEVYYESLYDKDNRNNFKNWSHFEREEKSRHTMLFQILLFQIMNHKFYHDMVSISEKPKWIQKYKENLSSNKEVAKYSGERGWIERDDFIGTYIASWGIGAGGILDGPFYVGKPYYDLIKSNKEVTMNLYENLIKDPDDDDEDAADDPFLNQLEWLHYHLHGKFFHRTEKI